MRRRMTVLALNAAMLAVAVFGTVLAVAAWRYAFTEERGELELAADRAAVVTALDRASPADPIELPRTQAGIDIAVYDPAGRRIAGTGPTGADALTRSALGGRIVSAMHGPRLRVAVPVATGEQVVGTVLASSNRAALLGRIGVGWACLLVLALLALIPTALAARRQARRLAAPLERLADDARRLGDGDFGITTSSSGISEIDTAGHALTETGRRLGALVARERTFTRDASHQLRTPLTGLRLLLETGLDADETTLREAVHQSVGIVDRVEGSVTDLLLLRINETVHQPVQVGELLEDVRHGYHGILTASGRPLRIERGDDLPVVHASTPALRQVLRVLVENALHHGRGEVRVVARNASGALALTVHDEGKGVAGAPADDVSSWQLDDACAPGHGLGLRLARDLVSAQGGRLLYRSGRDNQGTAPGTAFTVLLSAESERELGAREPSVS